MVVTGRQEPRALRGWKQGRGALWRSRPVMDPRRELERVAPRARVINSRRSTRFLSQGFAGDVKGEKELRPHT